MKRIDPDGIWIAFNFCLFGNGLFHTYKLYKSNKIFTSKQEALTWYVGTYISFSNPFILPVATYFNYVKE